MRASSRQQDRAFIAIYPPPGEHGTGLRDIATFTAKTLLAEIIGYTARGDSLQHFFGTRAFAANVAQHQHETIAAQGAAFELALMPRAGQHLDLGMRKRTPIRIELACKLHGESLARHSVTILQTRITHIKRWHARETRQLARHPIGIGVALFHP